MLAAERERRRNAGARMAFVMEKEDCDDFYKSTYGGFFDEEEDVGFQSPAESDSDVVDSDFDIDENEDTPSENEDGTEKKPRTRKIFTKAYKEPSVKSGVPRKKTSTLIGTNIIEKRLRERARNSGVRMPGRKPLVTPKRRARIRLSQDKLLQEAKTTERLNLKSLETFLEMEVEERKKRKIVSKRVKEITGPAIKYLSVSTEEPSSQQTSGSTKVSRNYLVFRDVENISFGNQPVASQPICVVTGRPAKYKDPLTSCFYSDIASFRAIRKAYSLYLHSEKPAPSLPS